MSDHHFELICGCGTEIVSTMFRGSTEGRRTARFRFEQAVRSRSWDWVELLEVVDSAEWQLEEWAKDGTVNKAATVQDVFNWGPVAAPANGVSK